MDPPGLGWPVPRQTSCEKRLLMPQDGGDDISPRASSINPVTWRLSRGFFRSCQGETTWA